MIMNMMMTMMRRRRIGAAADDNNDTKRGGTREAVIQTFTRCSLGKTTREKKLRVHLY